MTSEDDTWAQTLITVTPEDDATLREISDTVTLSSPSDAPLILDPDQIIYRRSLSHRQFIDPRESEETIVQEEQTNHQDAENQTYLQGIPVVEIPVEHADKSSQTMYMASPCPPLKYFKDIMSTMNEGSLPEMKKSNATATILTFHPEAEQILVLERLSASVPEEQLVDFAAELDAKGDAEMEVGDVLDFVVTRLFWIIDPSQVEVDTLDEETQTLIRFNNQTQVLMMDNHMQTDLTCEPKKSNTMLLSDYFQTKDMVVNYLEETFSKGIEAVVITDDILNEIIDKCAERIRYPMKEQITQTIATYKLNEDKEQVLKKLKLGVIVDPLEASIVIVPLLTDLLQTVCDTVSENALVAAQNVLQQLLQRTSTIIAKLEKLQTELQPRPIDEMLEKRRKKIMESMSRKETETIYTQTSLTGISEVKRTEEPKAILCSVCRRQSMCRWCSPDEEIENIPREGPKILRTQDILLAYKPCYIITTPSKKTEDLLPVCHSETKVKPASKARAYVSTESSNDSQDTIDVYLRDKRIEPEESLNEWSYVTDATLMKPCSMKESVSSINQSSSRTNSSSRRSTLTPRAVNALQILKDTFCNRENCVTSSLQSLKQNYPFKEEEKVCATCSSRNSLENKIFSHETFCTQQMCKAFSKLHLPKTNACNECTASRVSTKSYNAFKIIPIRVSQDSNC